MNDLPDINSPEIRSFMFTLFMDHVEKAKSTHHASEIIKTTPFETLTAETWKRLQGMAEALDDSSAYVMNTIEGMEFIVDDAIVMNSVANSVKTQMEKERER